MANYQDLKTRISDKIKPNNSGEITGQKLQDTLVDMVNTLGGEYMFAGVATPSTVPNVTDARIFYFATQQGTYTNFGNVEVPSGISILKYDSSWALNTLVTFDDMDSANANKGVFATLSALNAAYPNPRIGWYAMVGNESPYLLYDCQTNGTWRNTGQRVSIAGISANASVEDEVLIFNEE